MLVVNGNDGGTVSEDIVVVVVELVLVLTVLVVV